MTSYMQKKETIERKWYVIDAEGKPLGRVASKAAHVLRGKHKATFTPHIDCGDNVIIINAEKVLLTGNKLEDKKYYNHSMYPHNRLGRAMYKKLFVYIGNEHKHAAQKPEAMEI